MADSKNLYQRLLAITEEIGKIDKTGRNQQQGYAFIEQAQVVAEVRVQLAKHGVMIIPQTRDRKLERYEVTRSNGKPGVDIHATVKSLYTLVNVDDPQDRMECEWDGGEAIDSSDKASNKAMTASQKYFLMKLFNISDKDDPDADTHQLPAAAAQKPVEPPKRVGPGLINPDSMDRLRALLASKGMKGDEITAYAEFIIGKPKPTSEDDVQALIEALKQ